MYTRSNHTPTVRGRRPATIVFAVAATLLATATACTAPSAESDRLPGATGMSAGALGEPNAAEIRSTIEAENQRAAAAMVAGDLTASLANYSDNAISMMPGMPAMRGKAAIEQGISGMMKEVKMTAATFTTEDVTVAGDYAIESGSYTMTMQPKTGKAIDDVGKYMSLWQRQPDGSWKIVRDMNNSDLGMAPPM